MTSSPVRDGHVGPANIAAGVDVDLRGRALVGIARIGGVEIGRQLAEVFPVGGLPDHEDPVDPRGGLLRRLAIRVEPEALSDAVMQDDPLRLHVEPGEVGQDGIERLGVAAAFGVPLAAAERRPFPPGDAGRDVEDRGRALRPARIGDGLFPSPPVINANASGVEKAANAAATRIAAAASSPRRRGQRFRAVGDGEMSQGSRAERGASGHGIYPPRSRTEDNDPGSP